MNLAVVCVVALFNFSLGAIVFKSQKKMMNTIFFGMTLSIVGWIFANYFAEVTSLGTQLCLTRLTYIFSIWVATFFLYFVLIFPAAFKRYIYYFFACGLLSLMATILFFTPLMIKKVVVNDGTITIINGPYFVLFLILISAIILFSVILLFTQHHRTVGIDKLKFKYILKGTFLVAVLAPVLNIIIPIMNNDWSSSSYGPMSTVFFVGFTAYGILKEGLFDIRMAVVRSVTYAQVVATLAGLYVVLTFALSSLFGFVGSSPIELAINIVITLSLVFLFQPLRRFFDKITNKIFYKDNYDTDEFFGRVNKILAITTDLKDLLKDASIEINKTLKGSRSSLYVLTDNGKIVSGGTDDKSKIDDTDLINLFSYASNQGKIIIRGLMSENAPIKKLLSSNKIEIVLPLMKGHKLIGLFLMGENMSSNYTNRDVSVLGTISNGLIVAILNALAVQEIRDFNVTLRKKIDEATKELRIKNAMLKKLDKAKDEFVSMASHQLRTPLTSVKGYLSMVIEGDAGKVTQSQKDLLGEAFSSNEKMVSLVNDFLNVSRIQTGKFVLDKVPIDLSKLIAEEINDLQQNAKKRNLNMVYKPPKNFPILNIDVGKIRQVIMNFTDNALYYSNPDTDVNISLTVDGGDAVFKVIDTGIGVPVGERDQLFTKFYRASNARKQRPDGTGVGLYLAKRIVTDHGGKIVFETSEGKGSTFGFRLPIKELSV